MACASLLHVPSNNIKDVLIKIERALKAGGDFYFSVKATPHKACAEDAPTDFFVRLYRNSAGILSYVKEFLCKMTENMNLST